MRQNDIKSFSTLASLLGVSKQKNTKNKPKDPMFDNVIEDGEDHINVGSFPGTLLGKCLAINVKAPWRHPKFGNFDTTIGFLYFISNEGKSSEGRTEVGLFYKDKKFQISKVKNYRFWLADALYHRISQNRSLVSRLLNNTLPFYSYYVNTNTGFKESIYGANDHIEVINEVTLSLQSINPGNFNHLLTERGVNPYKGIGYQTLKPKMTEVFWMTEFERRFKNIPARNESINIRTSLPSFKLPPSLTFQNRDLFLTERSGKITFSTPKNELIEQYTAPFKSGRNIDLSSFINAEIKSMGEFLRPVKASVENSSHVLKIESIVLSPAIRQKGIKIPDVRLYNLALRDADFKYPISDFKSKAIITSEKTLSEQPVRELFDQDGNYLKDKDSEIYKYKNISSTKIDVTIEITRDISGDLNGTGRGVIFNIIGKATVKEIVFVVNEVEYVLTNPEMKDLFIAGWTPAIVIYNVKAEEEVAAHEEKDDNRFNREGSNFGYSPSNLN